MRLPWRKFWKKEAKPRVEEADRASGSNAPDRVPHVFDKAKYHYSDEKEFPADLPMEQAFIHTGLYLGWIVERGLCSDQFVKASGDLIARFKSREVTGPEIYEHWDGCLIDYMLNPEGNAFSHDYFDFLRGQYLSDYDELLTAGLPSHFHVESSWANYDRIKSRIDERFAAWRQQRR
jgi:hypothetical protein